MNKTNLKGSLFLLIATIIWGCTFVAQDKAADVIGTFEFHTLRTLLGAVVLIPVILIMDAIKKSAGTYVKPTKKDNKNLIIGGIICGAAHCIASCLQQGGMALGTEPGKSGFITAMYIIFVPILGIFLKKKIQPHIYACIALAVVGLYLLCITEEVSGIALGDFVTLLCAVAFSVQILAIDKYVTLVDCVKLSCVQFITSGTLAIIPTLIVEGGFHSEKIVSALPYIFFAGVMSCGIAYTCQVIGQKYSSSSTVASLIMSFESVVSVIASTLILNELMSRQEFIGCVLMFISIIVSQFDISVFVRKKA